MTDHEKIINLLKQRKSAGMNSAEFTNRHGIKDLETRITELKKTGYGFFTRKKSNGTIDYMLYDEPENAKKELLAPLKWEVTKDDQGRNVARQVPDEPSKPKADQEGLDL